MPTRSTVLGLRIPLPSEAPDAPGQIGNLATDLDQVLSSGYRGISDWIDYSANATGISGNKDASPGWVVSSAKYRYRAGRIQIRGGLYLNGGGSGFAQQVYLAYPISALVEDAGWGISGRVTAMNSSAMYDFVPIGTSATQWTFGIRNAAGLVVPNSSTSPFTWGQGSQLSWNLDYDFQS